MSLEELFERHHAELFRFVSRMTGDADDAKDIVQETFLTVALKPIPGGVSARAWLFQLALNLTRSGLRRRLRRQTLLRRNPHAVPAVTASPGPDADVEREQLRTAVRSALAELSERERTILLMREEGFAHHEIAAAVGTTTGSVGTMFARALDKLGRRLDPHWREAP